MEGISGHDEKHITHGSDGFREHKEEVDSKNVYVLHVVL